MGQDNLFGPEETCRLAGIGQILVFRLGREPLLVGSLGAVAAGVGISDELDHPVFRSVRLKEGTIGGEFVDGCGPLGSFRPFLYDHLVRGTHCFAILPESGLEFLGTEQDDCRIASMDSDDLVGLFTHR